jgi:transcriptional regulator with XRE-family HTH domain
MPESLGARLRQRREREQITLTTIAEQTKIKLSLLEALERDDISHWPAGIFRRAFIRAYASAIGLEPDVVVREFLELHPDPIEVVETAPAVGPGVDGAALSAGPPFRLHYLVGSAIGSLSRLRLGAVPGHRSAVDDPTANDCTPAKAPCSSEADLLAAAPESTQLNRMDELHEATPLLQEAASAPVKAPSSAEPDLLAAAHLCTELGRLDEIHEATPLLQEAIGVLDAVGLIVWIWHPEAAELRPALAHGYSSRVLAQMPKVGRDTDNATAAAFRSGETCVVDGSNQASGALVVPLMTPAGCAGVLAVELQHGREQRESLRALVTIFAAQLARLVGAERPAEAGELTNCAPRRTLHSERLRNS